MNGKIYPASYREDGSNNPLLQSIKLAPKTEHEILDLLFHYPNLRGDEFRPPVRKRELRDRYNDVNEIREFRMPFWGCQELLREFYSFLLLSYKCRNPFKDEHPELFRKQTEDSLTCQPDGVVDIGAKAKFIIGASGTGKTSMVQLILNTLPQVIEHTCYKGYPFIHTQILYLTVDCPSTVTIKSFLLLVLQAFDDALGNSTFFKTAVDNRWNEDMLINQVKYLIDEFFLGMLVIDEIQHLCLKDAEEEVAGFFTTLSNICNIPIVFIGTPKAQALLTRSLRATRRLTAGGQKTVERLARGSDQWEMFIKTLWTLQYTRTETPLTEKIEEALYEGSQGILALIIQLFIRVQQRAMADEKNADETITPELIIQVREEEFKGLEPLLRAIKENDLDQIIKYEDLMSLPEIIRKNGPALAEEAERIEFFSVSEQILQERISDQKDQTWALMERISSFEAFQDCSYTELRSKCQTALETCQYGSLDELAVQMIAMETRQGSQDSSVSRKNKGIVQEKPLPAEPPESLLALRAGLKESGLKVSMADYKALGKIGEAYEL